MLVLKPCIKRGGKEPGPSLYNIWKVFFLTQVCLSKSLSASLLSTLDILYFGKVFLYLLLFSGRVGWGFVELDRKVEAAGWGGADSWGSGWLGWKWRETEP